MALLGILALPAQACSQPDTWSVDTAFDLAASGRLPASYPQLPPESGVTAIPPSLLKAVGWVESNWRQFTAPGRPLVSFDFGYGIMQITSGMPGAFGNVDGDLPPAVESRIASNYVYNIAFGAQMLAEKWASTPKVGPGDPAAVEDWYYALWAYNGWGWANNPNNPRFSRQGTPATDPATYPYQERVLYLVVHPPKDPNGNPLWPAVNVTLPQRKRIGKHPGPLTLTGKVHTQTIPDVSATYDPATLGPMHPKTSIAVPVKVTNTGSETWLATGSLAVGLAYHLYKGGNPWQPFSPTASGLVDPAEGTVALPHPVLPGKTITLTAPIKVPNRPGSYRIAWDLAEGAGSLWFSQLGVPPYSEALQVLKPGATLITTPTPTVPPIRAEGLRYVTDTSIPDGSTVQPGTALTKGWLVYNNGQRGWGNGWRLTRTAGKIGPRSVSISAVGSCRATNIVINLRAPRMPGRYRAAWHMRDVGGHQFGDPLTIDITVSGPKTTPTPAATPSPTSRPTRTPLPTPTLTPVG